MDSLDAGDYEDTDAEKENYILAQNKLWVITGEVASFSDQITALTQQAATVQSQLGNPSQITAPQTGYLIRSSSSGRLNAGSADILALDAANLKLTSNPPGVRAGRLRRQDRFGLYLVLCRGVLGQTGGKAAGQGRQALDQER